MIAVARRRSGSVAGVLLGAGGRDIGALALLAAVEGGEPPVGQGQEPHRAGKPVDRAKQLFRRREPALGQRVVEGREVEIELERRLRISRGVAAVRGDRRRQRTAQPRQALAQQPLARPPGEGGAGDRRHRRALGPARRAVVELQQPARLTTEVEGDARRLRVGGSGAQGPRRTGEIIDPPLQHFGAPGEGVPAAEGSRPLQRQPQSLGRAVRTGGQKIAHPAEPMQVDGEPAAGARPVPGIAARPWRQGLAAEDEGPGEDLAAGAEVDGTQVAGHRRQALGPAAGEQPPVWRRAGPFVAQPTAHGEPGCDEDMAAGQSLDD